MSHRSLFWPITLILIVATTLVLMLTHAPVDPQAIAVAQGACPDPTADPTGYDICNTTAVAAAKTATAAANSVPPDKIIAGCPTDGPAHILHYPPYGDCMKTRTALLLLTEQAGGTPRPVLEGTITNNTSSSSSQAQSVPTFTPTSTFTSTPTATRTAGALASSTPQTAPTLRSVAIATPTATLAADASTPGIAATTCIPGEIIPINGVTDPQLALIVTFGDRPVGGGFTRNDGSYSILLRIGDERPGIYPVQVQDRATHSMVQEFNCQVPAFTPTPTPPIIPAQG